MPIEDYPLEMLDDLAEAARTAVLGSSVLTVSAWPNLTKSGKDHWRRVAAAVQDRAKELAAAASADDWGD